MWTEMGCRAQHTLADWSWSPLLGSMRMSRRGEIEPSSAVKTPEPFAEERASRRRKIINKIMNVIVVVGIAIDLFFAILYSVLDTPSLRYRYRREPRDCGPVGHDTLIPPLAGPIRRCLVSWRIYSGNAELHVIAWTRIGVTFVFDSRRDLFADLPRPSSDCTTDAHDPGRLGSVRRRGQGFASLAIPHPDVDRRVRSSFLRHISTDDVCALPDHPIFNPSGRHSRSGAGVRISSFRRAPPEHSPRAGG